MLALDPFHDFEGLKRCESIDEAIEELNEDGSNPDRPARVALTPPIDDDSEAYADRVFAEVIRFARNFLFVLDESVLWMSPEGSDRLRKIVLQGRRWGIRLAPALQQLQLAPRVVMSQLTQLVVFNTVRPQDVEMLRKWVGDDVAFNARNLGVGEAYLVNL